MGNSEGAQTFGFCHQTVETLWWIKVDELREGLCGVLVVGAFFVYFPKQDLLKKRKRGKGGKKKIDLPNSSRNICTFM